MEFERGTEKLDEYIATFEAHYRYRDSGEADRDYDGFPTVLCITTDREAEGRMSEAAFRVWYRRGGHALPILLTTSRQIREHPEGILGPIWRTPAVATDKKTERRYWLPGRPPRGLFGAPRRRAPVPRFMADTAGGGSALNAEPASRA